MHHKDSKISEKNKRLAVFFQNIFIDEQTLSIMNKETKPEHYEMSVQYEPARRNRFEVSFPEKYDIKPWVVHTCETPRVNFDYDQPSWGPIKIELIDLIAPNTTKKVLNLCETFERPMTVKIKTLDPTGVVIETWVITVSKILHADFGKFDYSDNGLKLITIILQPKNCVLKKESK